MRCQLRQNLYLVLDVSGSMFGEPMQSMLNGVDGLLAALRASPEIDIDNTVVSVIAFSTKAKAVVEEVPLKEFVMPELKVGGCTNVAGMITELLVCAKVDDSFAKVEHDAHELPMVFFFMDGYPTDASKLIDKSIEAFHAREWSAYASFAIAGGAEKHFLARLTSPRRVFDLTINPDFQAAIAPLPNRQGRRQLESKGILS